MSNPDETEKSESKSNTENNGVEEVVVKVKDVIEDILDGDTSSREREKIKEENNWKI